MNAGHIRARILVLAVLAALGFAVAGPAVADHGDPSTRPDPEPAPFAAEGPWLVGQVKQDALVLTLTVTPPAPTTGELVRLSLNVHDPDQQRDFQGTVKVTVLAEGGKELASGQALSDEGEAAFLYIPSEGGAQQARFEFDADIPAWSPARVKRPAPSTPPLDAKLEKNGSVVCRFAVQGAAGETGIPLPWIIGGGCVLVLAAIVFLRKRA